MNKAARLVVVAALFVLAAQGEAQEHVWRYPVLQASAVDGDTARLRLDLGFGLHKLVDLRLIGVDTAETNRGPEDLRAHGRNAASFATVWLLEAVEDGLIAEVAGADSFGRALGDLVADEGRLSQALLDERLAVEYDGRISRDQLQDEHRRNAEARRQKP